MPRSSVFGRSSLVAALSMLATLSPREVCAEGAGQKAGWIAEGVGNFFLAQFISTAIHEGVHFAALKAYGYEDVGINLIPFQQQVVISDETFNAMPRDEKFVVAMLPQVVDPLTPSLPRWIYTPNDDTWWLRFSSMYYLFNTVFQSAAVITVSWVEFAKGDEPEKDIGVAAAALTDSRGGQAGFISGVTVLLGTNLILRRHDLARAWNVIVHKSNSWDPKPSAATAFTPTLSVLPMPHGAAGQLTLRF